jgi:hypothetical protein
MDLTARRTDWGPALGGDGVVVHTTLPDISYAFGNAEEKRAGMCLCSRVGGIMMDASALPGQLVADVPHCKVH